MKIPAYVIHLDSAKERLPIIDKLEKDFKIPITIFSASDGSELWGSRKLNHPFSFDNRVYKFWRTHAMIIRKRCIPYILKSFDNYLSKGVCLYGDWLYNNAIKKNKLKVYCPISYKYYISQSEGYVSALTGKVRS